MMEGVENPELSTGSRVGPYTLLFRLGKGGMGEVWAASAGGGLAGFQKLVALKLLLGAEHGSNSSIMFFDEARAASALQHASIVPTLDLGRDEDTFYLAMEMVRGPSLTGLLQRLAIKKKPMPPAIVAYIGERIASALDYAYERASIDGKKLKLVHRDISPHNVLLDAAGTIRLSDFGVARTAVQDHKSRYGTVRGKPSYMAPEQVTGSVKSMEAVVNHTPKPLTERIPGFPENLWQVIKKALEKAPENRWQGASEFAQALADAGRTLPGSTTVTRDLGDLINDLFPSGSFDVDAKAQDALSAIEGTVGGESVSPSEHDMRDQAIPTAFSENLPTNVGYAPDPLAPEAIQELQQALDQPPPQPFMVPPTNPHGPQFAGVTGGSVSAAGMLAQPQKSKTPLFVGGFIVLLGLAGLAVAMGINQKQSQSVITAPGGQPSAQTTKAKPATRRVGAVQGKQKPQAAAPAATPTPPPPVTKRARRPRPPRSAAKRPDPVAKATPPTKRRPSTKSGPITKGDVFACVKNLPKGPGRQRLLVGVSQAGNNEATLKRLYSKCQAARNGS
jgi:serine/threonine protein kinase